MDELDMSLEAIETRVEWRKENWGPYSQKMTQEEARAYIDGLGLYLEPEADEIDEGDEHE